tara:strand:- start:28 stop:444 length:417 start_codon:yes stop_codon:yes gene_type:complete
MSTLRTNALEGVDAKNSITIVAGAGNITTTNVQQALAKVICNITQVGTQTIKNSMNVSSITDTDVGKTTFNFTNSFTDEFWIGGMYQNGANAVGNGSWNVSQGGYIARTSSSVNQVSYTGSALVDSGHVDIQNFGDLA